MSEEEVMSKFDLESSKKISQCFKRWRYLFLQNDPESIVLKEEKGDSGEDYFSKKVQILKNLEEYVVARVQNTGKGEKTNSGMKLSPFSVIYGAESSVQNIRRKWWGEFKSNRSPQEICADLNNNVGELVTSGFTNLPGIFNALSLKLKMASSENRPKTLDEKLAAITSLLKKWPQILLFPEILLAEDGKLHTYTSVTHQHQLGSVYEEMVARLKKKIFVQFHPRSEGGKLD